MILNVFFVLKLSYLQVYVVKLVNLVLDFVGLSHLYHCFLNLFIDILKDMPSTFFFHSLFLFIHLFIELAPLIFPELTHALPQTHSYTSPASLINFPKLPINIPHYF
jgi:hypothetical protein